MSCSLRRFWAIALCAGWVGIAISARGDPPPKGNGQSPAPPAASAGSVAVNPAAAKPAAEKPVDAKPLGQPAKEIGNNGGGSSFRQAPGKGSVLVGCQVTTGPYFQHIIIKSIVPIFENADGTRSDGSVQGQPCQNPMRIEAEEGHAVARLVGMAGDRIDAFYIVFMRRRGDRELGPRPINTPAVGSGAGTLNALKGSWRRR